MNIILIVIGVILIVVGGARMGIKTKAGPKHGDRRIVQEGDNVRIEQYIAFPAWVTKTHHESLEDARHDKERWEQLRAEKPEVIE